MVGGVGILCDDNPTIVLPSAFAQLLSQIVHSLGSIGGRKATRGEIDLRIDNNQQTVRQLRLLSLDFLLFSVLLLLLVSFFFIATASCQNQSGEEHDSSDEFSFHSIVLCCLNSRQK